MPVENARRVTTPNAQLRRAERLLKNAGHDPGKVDGRPSEELTRALKTYQRAVGLPVTGTLDAATMKQLRATGQAQRNHSDRFATLGMKGADIRLIEARLKKLGYDVGKVDGIYSRSTFEAVKAFKADRRDLPSRSGGMGIPAQEALARAAGVKPGDKGKDANVRALTFNWTERYRKGGDAADEKMFDRLSAQADVLGLTEFVWHKRITDGEKNWGFYNPDPKGDGAKGNAGQVLAWNKDTFKLVEKGTTLLNKKTKIQPKAAGPTNASEKSIIWAKLRHKETGEIWTVAVAHFVPSKHLGGAALKLWKKQRDELAAWMKEQGPRTLVMGDFNAQWKDAVTKPLRKVANVQSAPSHGKRGIDWILRSKDLKATGKAKALDNHGQSDHKPVKGTVRG